MTKEAEALVEERKEEAGEKGISEKARIVVESLGRRRGVDDSGFLRTERPDIFDPIRIGMVYQEDRLTITELRGGGELYVFFQEKRVYFERDEDCEETVIHSYIPGEWEGVLDNAYEDAKRRDCKREDDARRVEELKKNFGLD